MYTVDELYFLAQKGLDKRLLREIMFAERKNIKIKHKCRIVQRRAVSVYFVHLTAVDDEDITRLSHKGLVVDGKLNASVRYVENFRFAVPVVGDQ